MCTGAIFANASIPAEKNSSRPFDTIPKSEAKGILLKADTNMSRGVMRVSGTISHGRCLMNSDIPEAFSKSTTFSDVSFAMSNLLKSIALYSPSFSMRTDSSLRLSPRSTLKTLPLTVAVIICASLRLSTNMGVPILTLSPSLTTTRGTHPVKSSGHIATSVILPSMLLTMFSAVPSRFRSNPLRRLITFDIRYVCSLKFKVSQMYEIIFICQKN